MDSGRCGRCWCCTACAAECGRKCEDHQAETNDETVLRILDIDANSERILHAAVCREKNIVDAADYFEGLSVEDLQIEDENSEESDG